MKKSRIIANLEGILEPVPKKRRVQLNVNTSFQQWYASFKKSPEWQEYCERKNKENTETVKELIGLLNSRENISIAQELRHYFNAGITGKKGSNNLDIFRGVEFFLKDIKCIMGGFLGCNAEGLSIEHGSGLFSRYDPEDATMHIARRYEKDDSWFVSDICHEYCHHLHCCTSSSLAWVKQNAVAEGFATCAGRVGAILYGIAIKNPKIEVYTGETMHLRLEMFRKLYVENSFDSYTSFSEICYTIGTTAFITAEAKHGKKIYREILRSREPAEYLVKKLK